MDIKSVFRDLAVSVMGAALYSVLAAIVPSLSLGNLGRFVGVDILNNLLVQLVVLTAGIFVLLVGTRRLFEWYREQQKPSHGPLAAVIKSPPDNIIWGGFIDKYGVKWRARYGHNRFGGTGAHIEGPFCPRCGTEMRSDEKTRLIKGKAEIWNCPDCGRDYVRPAETYLDERDNVAKICESVVGRAEQSGIDVIEQRSDFHTEEWNKGSGLSYSNRRPY